MKRRNFLYYILILSTQAFSKAVTWAVKGKLGYVEVASASAQRFKKTCDTCKHLFRDETIKGAGLCRQSGIMAAAKTQEVHVMKTGHCLMWQKDG